MKTSVLQIKKTADRGRGVFAMKRLLKGRVIESAPLVALSRECQGHICKTLLNYYQFDMSEGLSCIGLGYTSLYNHSRKPNATYIVNSKRQTITVKALRNIRAGEEILIDYGYDATVWNVSRYFSEVAQQKALLVKDSDLEMKKRSAA